MADIPVRPRFAWQINRRLLAATLLLLPILIWLGTWQLSRAEQKAELVDQLQLALRAEPMTSGDYAARTDAELRFHPIRLRGRFDPERYWLVENKIYQTQLGYMVVALFSDAEGNHFLVDRGWVPAPVSREVLPAVSMPAGELEIEGVLDRVSRHPLLEYNGAGGWPQRVLTLDLARQAETVGLELEPWLVHMGAASPAVLTPIWQPLVVPVAKHLGYAAQWFTMAAALALVSLFANSNLGRVLFHRSPA